MAGPGSYLCTALHCGTMRNGSSLLRHGNLVVPRTCSCWLAGAGWSDDSALLVLGSVRPGADSGSADG